MKIAMVTPFIGERGSPRGGVAAVTRALSTHLRELGHEVHLIQVGAPHSMRSSKDEDEQWTIARGALPGVISFWTIESRQIANHVRKIRPDLVHVHGAASWGAAVAGMVPTVLTVHGAVEREVTIRRPMLGRLLRPLICGIESAAFGRVDNLIRINPYVDELRSIRTHQRVFDIPNPIAATFFESFEQDDANDGQLLWIGAPHSRKNLLAALQIFGEFRSLRRDAQLVVAGVAEDDNSEYVSRCRGYILEKNLSGSVKFIGRVSSLEIRSRLGESEALLMTSVQETAPCVISEALARGTYVVGPRAFGLPAMLPDERFGYLYGLSDSARKIAQMISERVVLNRSCRALRVAEAWRYHPHRVAQQTSEAYEQILAS